VTSVEREPASFRDPSGSVLYVDGRVLRGLDAEAAADWRSLAATRFFPRLLREGRAVATEEVDSASLPRDAGLDGFALVLEHERIPFVSYPHEWTFEMLRHAAELHLEILLAALGDDMTMKDGYALNVQWRGASPVFIDIGSFERLRAGPWAGYRQFCQTFLFPLLLQAYLDVPFQRYLRGHLEGLPPSDMRKILGGRHLARKGVLRHVHLQALMEARVKAGTESVKKELAGAGFGKELTKATVTKLLALVRGLRSKRSTSGWASYRTTCSYSDADRSAKEHFVEAAVSGRRPGLVWDLGSNDGAYAKLAARHADYVVAADGDDVVVDSLYRSLREGGPANVLPLVIDLVDPTPGRGWRGKERAAFTDRARPDLVMGLALVHHLAIGANVPLAQVVEWFHSFGGDVVIEFVEPHDPMARRLLGNKPAGMYGDYRRDAFEALLERSFRVDRTESLPSGSRTLYLARPR
jgi:hypothetical protein